MDRLPRLCFSSDRTSDAVRSSVHLSCRSPRGAAPGASSPPDRVRSPRGSYSARSGEADLLHRFTARHVAQKARRTSHPTARSVQGASARFLLYSPYGVPMPGARRPIRSCTAALILPAQGAAVRLQLVECWHVPMRLLANVLASGEGRGGKRTPSVSGVR